jgi:sRNA-binding carbon storage regulator CsrA
MPKTIWNPLREGLPSKIYLLAYNGPVSGYEVAQKIQGLKPGEVPQTGKIYGWVKKLKTDGVLRETKDGYVSEVGPLIGEIRETLKRDHGAELSELECYMVSKLIDDWPFRNLVEFSYFYRKGFFQGEVDAARQVMDVLGDHMMHSIVFMDKFSQIKSKADFDALWNDDPGSIPLAIRNELHDKVPVLLTLLESEKSWHDLGQLARSLGLLDHDAKEIIDALSQSTFVEVKGNKVRIGANPPEELSFFTEESQKKIDAMHEEDDYFKRTGKLKPGGIYEQEYRQNRLAIDGKKIKQWAFPINSCCLPKNLVEKLCNLSSTYHLFKEVTSEKNSYLFAEWNNKRLRVFRPDRFT